MTKTALYLQIEKDIQDKIALGYYKENTLIPTEQELARAYNVSRVTIRKATEILTKEGVLEPIVGVGTFVRAKPLHKNIVTLNGFSSEMRMQGVEPSSVVPIFMIKNAPSNIASVLGIEENEPVYYFERLRYGDDKLFIIEKTHMSARLYPDISLKVLENSKYEFIEKEKNIAISHSNHTVNPCLCNAQIAELFGIAENTPIVTIANITYLENGDVLDITELTLNTPYYQLSYTKKR